jgi:hypothetical protein
MCLIVEGKHVINIVISVLKDRHQSPLGFALFPSAFALSPYVPFQLFLHLVTAVYHIFILIIFGLVFVELIFFLFALFCILEMVHWLPFISVISVKAAFLAHHLGFE